MHRIKNVSTNWGVRKMLPPWIRQLCGKAGFTPVFATEAQDVAETFTRVAAEGEVALLLDYLSGPPPPGTCFVRLSDKPKRCKRTFRILF